MYENEVILDINNSKQNLLILSADIRKPVLLFVQP